MCVIEENDIRLDWDSVSANTQYLMPWLGLPEKMIGASLNAPKEFEIINTWKSNVT